MAAMTAVFGVFSSLVLFLFSLFFLGSGVEKTPDSIAFSNHESVPQNLSGSQPAQGALPPQQTQSAQEYVTPAAGSWKAPDTGELVVPSVTEGTTKLLNKDKLEEGTKR